MIFHRNKISVTKAFIVLVLSIYAFNSSFCQVNEVKLKSEYNGISWIEFVEKVESEYNFKIYYNPDSIPDFTISFEITVNSLAEILKNNLKSYNLFPVFDKNNNIFISSNKDFRTKLPIDFFLNTDLKSSQNEMNSSKNGNGEFHKTEKEFITKTIVVGNKKDGAASQKANVYGYLKNKSDGSSIVGGTIYIHELSLGTASDNTGYFSITLDKGKYNIVVRSVDSEEENYQLNVLSSGRVDFNLKKKLFALNEVTISSEKFHNVRGNQMGFEKLTTKSIKSIPLVLGERDIVKVALLLPGIQTVGEGTSGFNVRGSPADQNIFYINEVPIYNTSHLFGFFSSFNADVVSDFSLYKSNIPAKYGGRLSSIFDIATKQGNQEKFTARGGISPITGRLLIEGPIQKGKSSFLVGVRSTYSDWILNLVKDPEIKKSSAQFADAVANLNYQLNPNNNVKIFTYYSYDDINMTDRAKYNYQNAGASVNFSHFFRKKHQADISLIHSTYGFTERNQELEIAAYKHSYKIDHDELKIDFILRPNKKHRINFGTNSVLYTLNKGTHEPFGDLSLIKLVELGTEKGIETGIFLNDEWNISPLFSITGGLRYNLYSFLGPQNVYSYKEGLPFIIENIEDTLSFANNEIIKTYKGLDYRISSKFLLNQDISVKLSYNKLHQYIFMLSNTIALSPTDKWKLSDYNIKPMDGNQLSLGLYSDFKNGKYSVSVETYYKSVNNLVEYKDGANLLVTEIPEVDVLQGSLSSYGIEFMLKKPKGKFNGWFNYTYSKSSVLVDGDSPQERNNYGIPYPSNYDKPHALNIVSNYKFSRRFEISANMVYSSGRPITYPTAIYNQGGTNTLYYSLRNEYRIPDYFRLDLSVKVEGNLQFKKIAHGSWVFSVYNVTGRNNAYSVYFIIDENVIKGYKLSIFGSPVFSLTYNFKLGNYAD